MQTPTPYAPAEALPIVRREASHNGESLTESLQSGSGGLSRSWGRAVHRREPVHGMPDPAATKPTPENPHRGLLGGWVRERLALHLGEARERLDQQAARLALPAWRMMDSAIKAALDGATRPAAATAARYAAQVAADLRSQRLPHERATSAAGYQLPRTAWQVVLLAQAAHLRAESERARRRGDLDAARALTVAAWEHVAAREALARLGRASQPLRRPLRRSARYRAPPPPAAAVVLGWQVARDPAATRHGLALLVLGATGCRPAELHGATVERTPDGVRIVLRGAKVGAARGQPVRRLSIDLPAPVRRGLPLMPDATARMLADAAEAAGGRLALRHTDADRRSLRRALAAAAPGLTPYAYRHAMGSLLKAAGTPPAQAAAVLGHASTASLLAYGRRRAGGGGLIPRAEVSRAPRTAALCRPTRPRPARVPLFAPPPVRPPPPRPSWASPRRP